MLYNILWSNKNDSIEEIKKQYRLLSRNVHPDRAGNTDDSNEMFRKVDHAYKIISNPVARFIYDVYGDKGIEIYEEDPQYYNRWSESTNYKKILKKEMDQAFHQEENARILQKLQNQNLTIKLSTFDYVIRSTAGVIHPTQLKIIAESLEYNCGAKLTNKLRLDLGLSSKEDLSYSLTHNDNFTIRQKTFNTRLKFSSGSNNTFEFLLSRKFYQKYSLSANFSMSSEDYVPKLWINCLVSSDQGWAVNPFIILFPHGFGYGSSNVKTLDITEDLKWRLLIKTFGSNMDLINKLTYTISEDLNFRFKVVSLQI